jgi:hypothetical protein
MAEQPSLPLLPIDYVHHQKMTFLFNAIENGWEVKKRDDKYVFTKKHEGKREVYLESYLQHFIESNMSMQMQMHMPFSL